MARIDGSQRGALVSIESARRIARAVQAYEQGKRDDVAPRLKRGFDEGDPVKIGRTTEKWAKGTTTELELIYREDCEDAGGSGGETLEAHNLSYDVVVGATCIVALGQNGCWYLVEAESCPDEGSDEGSGSDCGCTSIGGQDLTTVTGYDQSKTQVLAHEEGCLKWIDTTECDNAEEGFP
jgi:hypothetical protein